MKLILIAIGAFIFYKMFVAKSDASHLFAGGFKQGNS